MLLCSSRLSYYYVCVRFKFDASLEVFYGYVMYLCKLGSKVIQVWLCTCAVLLQRWSFVALLFARRDPLCVRVSGDCVHPDLGCKFQYCQESATKNELGWVLPENNLLAGEATRHCEL